MEDVLIIGGGFAGLAAGVALAGEGRRVRLLEQKPRLGGRAASFSDPVTGATLDNGQHLFMGCYHATIRFLETLGTLDRIRFQPRLRIDFLDPPGRVTTLECPDLRAPWHLLAGVLRSRSFGAREKLQVLRMGRALESGRATHNGCERLSVEEWLSGLRQSEKLRRNFWDLLCIAAMNEDPRRASARIFERVLRLALFTSPENSRLGISRVGLSDCYTEAATDYIVARGGRVEAGRGVAALIFSGGACTGAKTADGEALEAKTVLSAVPWIELARLLPGDLPRSDTFFGATLTLRPAPIISINLWFDRPVTDLEFAGLRGTTIQWLFNRGKILGPESDYVSLVLSGARDHMARTKQDLADMAVRELGQLLPAARTAKLLHSLVLKERYATFSPDCDADAVRPAARTPVRGLFLAGDWTATDLPATIEGAVQSGYTAASEVLKGC